MLTREALLLAHLRFAECVIQGRHELRALASQGITRAGVDQRFNHALVAQPQVDAIAQLHERAIGRLASTRDDRGDPALAYVPHSAESETDALVPDDGELVARLVDVG